MKEQLTKIACIILIVLINKIGKMTNG